MITHIVVVAFVVSLTNSARILGIIPTPSYSHQIAYRPLWKELTRRGHELVLLTSHPMNDTSLPNLKEIDLSFAIDYVDKDLNMDETLHKTSKNFLKFIEAAVLVRTKVNDLIFELSEVQNLLHNETEHFDLLINEISLRSFLGFSYRFKAPVIGVCSLDAFNHIQTLIGGFSHPVLYPDVFLPKGDDLSFFDRLIAVLSTLIMHYINYFLLPIETKTMAKHFGEDCPPPTYFVDKLDMVFSYTNLLFHKIRPTVPANVFIDGMHILEPKPLPKDLKEYMDKSERGVVYFSLGSSVKSKDLSEVSKKVLVETFAELPFDVLWKFEVDLEEKPDNVKIVKWAPQHDLIRHPNIKAFIFQGGLQSIEEALHARIPMLVMPISADQPHNAFNVVKKGYGLSLDMETIDKESFKGAILEIIHNPKYRNKVKEASEMWLDQPMSSLERAVWWTEYVIRNKGAQHLKGAANSIPTYQYFLLDIVAFCLGVVLFIVFVIVMIFRGLKKITSNIMCRLKKKHD